MDNMQGLQGLGAHSTLATLVGRAARDEFRRARMTSTPVEEERIYSRAADLILQRYPQLSLEDVG